MTDLGKCLWCGKATQPFKGGQYRKFCKLPKRCAYKYHNELGKLEREKGSSIEYEKHVNSPDWLRLEDIAKAIGVKTTAGAWHAAKSAGIEPKKVCGNGDIRK